MAGAARGNQGLISAQNAGIMGGAGGAAQAFGQGAQARAGEEFGALAGYSGLAGQQRGQDLQRAQMSGEQAYRQAQLELAQRQRNDQRNQAFEGMRQNVFEQQMAGQQAGEAANAGIYNTTADLAQRQAENDRAQQNAWIQAGTSGIGTGLSLLGRK
jgi:hypothetical protein